MTKSLSARFRGLFGRRAAKASGRPTNRPQLEALEDRTVPTTVKFGGGGILPHVEVQAMYYGSEWAYDPSLSSQQASLDSFLKGLVTGPYMDMLSKAGYGVGKGTADAGIVDNLQVKQSNGTLYVSESTIVSELQSKILTGKLKSPDSNRLYIVFVEPNVRVDFNDGLTSTNPYDFRDYHNSFLGVTSDLRLANIRYALVPYPGGSVGNADAINFLSAQDSMTVMASREVVNAVTDANADYKGWEVDFGGSGPGINSGPLPMEIGDYVGGISDANVVYLSGHAVSRIIDQHLDYMTPAGAQSKDPVTFELDSYGTLWKLQGGQWTRLMEQVDKLSDQGIDTTGQAMVDIVTNSGFAYEYHDWGGFTFLSPFALDAKAGQGASYVLLNYGGGTVWEFDASTSSLHFISHDITAIDAGTDWTGVNTVDVITTNAQAWAVSESNGWQFLKWNAASISAGQQGVSAVVDTTGDAFLFICNGGFPTVQFLNSGVKTATVGTDSDGHYMIDLLFTNYTLWEYRSQIGWFYAASDVSFVDKGHAGVVDYVSGDDHNLWELSGSGVAKFWTQLDTGVLSAA